MAQACAQKQEVVKYGPYGNQCVSENFSMKVEGCKFIKEVIVRHGYIVDAIGFVVADPCGSETNMFGGDGGNESKIVLKCGEFITQISGTSGEYAYANNTRLISTIKIHTNLCPGGYGPFGTGQATKNVQSFASPMPLDGRIVGFFGNAQGYLLSLGIYAEKPLLKQGC
ncbi:horcolin-like [Amaranthus tricolor]|uniref:horcolin-like n=1 Tax=Amaranthus tricolor TaxID=29722 RepID=UPI002589226C|nr:horcolin-like isoform X2 [Amaranthus tricolor]XP_057529517.1 horcolin-like [Amaranthus tricolor]